VLNTLEARGLMDDTMIIRTSDHGEMGLSHGGMRQKNFETSGVSTASPPRTRSTRRAPDTSLSQGTRAQGAIV